MFTRTWVRFKRMRRAMLAWMMFWMAMTFIFAFWTYSIQDSLAKIAGYFELKSRRLKEDI